jgi:hypothetical protein
MMGSQKYAVFLFPSVSYALKAEKILIAAGIAHKLIPVPRQLSSDCGVCLRITEEQQAAVIEALREKVVWEALSLFK